MSSGLIVATGTGSTGWASSIHRACGSRLLLPGPGAPQLVFFVREAWPGPRCDVSLTEGLLEPGSGLRITSRMGAGGVVFGDGIEADRIDLGWGQSIDVRRAERSLNLVVA